MAIVGLMENSPLLITHSRARFFSAEMVELTRRRSFIQASLEPKGQCDGRSLKHGRRLTFGEGIAFPRAPQETPMYHST